MVRQATLRARQRMLGASALVAAAMLSAAPAFAQDAAAAPAAAPIAPAPSTNAMENLIRLLVQQGTITQANGEQLLGQARAEAEIAKANVAQASANAGLPPPPEGTVRVPYVPETVRRQIADQVRTEVMAQAQTQGWAAPDNAAPDWTRRITLYGDVRFRSQSDFFAKGNYDGLVDVAAINNQAGGFDFFRDFQNLPILNTTEDRPGRMRVRARLGVDATLNDYLQAGIRIATGNDPSPISTNQDLGGGFAKKNLYVDLAYLRVRPRPWAELELGRFPNPFKSTQLLFDEDLNFDGAALKVDASVFLPKGLNVAVVAGAFPLDFNAADFPTRSVNKRDAPTKWLFSAQLNAGYTFDNGVQFAASAAYHDFRNVSGELSDTDDPNQLCVFNAQDVTLPGNANDPLECSTDWSRANNPRKGNTLFEIRNPLIPDTANIPLSDKNYLGLIYKYRVLNLQAMARVPINDRVHASLTGDYIVNLAYDRGDACRYAPTRYPFNNVEQSAAGSFNPCDPTDPGTLQTGNKGFLVALQVGHDDPRKWGEWRVDLGYRYLQSDATLDSFVDSDFHLGGTNVKGYTIAAAFGLFNGMTVAGRWLSANEVSGPPLAIDVLQVDFNVHF